MRKLRFDETMEVSLLSSRRQETPFGLGGAETALPGQQRVERKDGTVEPLPGLFNINVEPGDCVEIETPGGGGLTR